MNEQNVVATIEGRIAPLSRCVESMKAGTCPMCSQPLPAPAAEAKPARAPVKVNARKPAKKSTSVRVTADQVLAAIVDGKGLTAAEVGVKLGCSVENAWYHLNRLKKDARLIVGTDKKYRRAVAPAGN
jgi:hypothetical protein